LGICVVSTHAPEEEELLNALALIQGTIFLAPRHPERFDSVAKLLEAQQISYCRWTSRPSGFQGKRVVLIDVIGELPSVYALSDIAIVAGSFSSKIGGHNVLEPCLYGIPVLFGPHMQNQKELAAKVLQAGAGKQVSAANLSLELSLFSEAPDSMKNGAFALSCQTDGSLEKTWRVVFHLLESEKNQKTKSKGLG
jgi:3-deoxy-D-manno-octulosonic-acid transferase